jgi:hypothetical protein
MIFGGCEVVNRASRVSCFVCEGRSREWKRVFEKRGTQQRSRRRSGPQSQLPLLESGLRQLLRDHQECPPDGKNRVILDSLNPVMTIVQRVRQ